MTIEQTLQSLVHSLERIYGDLLVRIVLYGSTARGDDTDESDIDIAVIMKDGASPEMYGAQLDVVVDLQLECDKVISIMRINVDKFNECCNMIPLYKNIKDDGIVLWEVV